MQTNFIRKISVFKAGGNPLIKEFSGYGVSTIVFHSSRIMTELLVAKLVGPKLFGIWYLLNLLITYRSVTFIGVVNGMLLKVPILRGKQEHKQAVIYQNVTFLIVIASVCVTALVLTIIAAFGITDYSVYLLPLTLLFFANQYYYFIDAFFISHSSFNQISRMQMLCALLFPSITIPLVYFYSLSGFIIGTSFAYLIAVLIVYLKFDFSIRPQFDVKVFRQLVKTGFPIMLVGIIYTFFITVDRWMIELMLGTEFLGKFSMAILTFGMLTILPATMSRQFYSKMAFDWGRTHSNAALESWCRKQATYSFYLILITVAGVMSVFPLLIRFWLTQYQESIFPIVIISVGVLSMPLSAGWGDVINILGRQKVYLKISLFLIGVNILLNFLFITFGLKIIGVAMATSISFILYNLAIRLTARRMLAHG